jgi:hypothetical protein
VLVEISGMYFPEWPTCTLAVSFSGGTGVLTQGLMLARQVLYNLSHNTSP